MELVTNIEIKVSHSSAVGSATGYGPDNQRVEFDSQSGQEFSLFHIIQTGFGAHTASYPMGTRGSFPGGKAASALG
jgi:hypothetical protein